MLDFCVVHLDTATPALGYDHGFMMAGVLSIAASVIGYLPINPERSGTDAAPDCSGGAVSSADAVQLEAERHRASWG
jgi:hypothetical protein